MLALGEKFLILPPLTLTHPTTMKTHIYSNRYVVAALLGLSLPATAQSLVAPSQGTPGAAGDEVSAHLNGALPGVRIQPMRHASATVAEPQLMLGSTLLPNGTLPTARDTVVRPPASLASVVRDSGGQGMGAAAQELRIQVAVLASAYQTPGGENAPVDPAVVAEVVTRRVAAEPAKVLEIVESEISARPNCACEVVKAAIKASDADAAKVAEIVETASMTAPDMMRIISQCALAAMPDALSAVQSVMAKLEPGAGDASGGSKHASKDAKSSKSKVVIPPQLPPPAASPLDLPRYTVPIVPVFFPPPVTPVVGKGGVGGQTPG